MDLLRLSRLEHRTLADIEGRVEIAIRDFDQTVIGNPAHDLIRLGLSLATVARGSDLPGVTTAVAMEQVVAGYTSALSNRSRQYKDFEEIPKPLRRVLRQAVKREWRHLAEERIKDVKPSIPLVFLDRFSKGEEGNSASLRN